VEESPPKNGVLILWRKQTRKELAAKTPSSQLQQKGWLAGWLACRPDLNFTNKVPLYALQECAYKHHSTTG
jgi:hypothetical protein